MIIHEPELERSHGEICLSARIETQRPIPDFPERLWFRYPESYAPYLSPQSDAFLLCLLLAAMRLGEAVQARGAISPRLAGNLPRLQELYLPTHPGRLHNIELELPHLEAQPSSPSRLGVGSAFSGGVDSLYTLFTRRPEAQPPATHPLTHAIFIDGFDIYLHQQGTYQRLLARYSQFFEAQGLQLLTVRTNVYAFSQFRVNWVWQSGLALVGTAMTFGGLLQRFIKPGEQDRLDPDKPEASYYAIPLTSTESVEVELDRPELHRFDKLKVIAHWPGAQDHLRVCINPVKTADGSACYRCAKCLNALTYLELLGVRQHFRNFRQPFNLRLFVRFLFSTNNYLYYYPHNPRIYLENGRRDLYLLYYLFFLPLSVQPLLRKLAARWAPEGWLYRLERWVYRGQVGGKEGFR